MDLVIAPYRQTYGDVLNRSKSADPEDKDLWTLLSDTSIRKRAGLLCLWEKKTDCGSLPEKSSLFEGSENQISNLCLINNSCPNDKQSDLTPPPPELQLLL